MIKCPVCNSRHRTPGALARCQNPDNPVYIALITERHEQGFHSEGTGGHHHCPLCNPKPIDPCGCTGGI